MRKEPFITAGLIAAILIVGFLIIRLAGHARTLEVAPPAVSEGNNAAGPGQSNPENLLQNGTCPSSLGIYYTVDRNNTEMISDDTIYVAIRNFDQKDFHAKLFVDNTYQGEASLDGNASTKIISGTVTSWWRAGSGTMERKFSLELQIDGCGRKLSELMPALPITQNVPSASAAGGSGGSSPASGEPTLNIMIYNGHLPD